MKKNIHPTYKKLKINIGKDNFITRSTLSVDSILMDIDYRKHPAWNKDAGSIINQSSKSVSSFNRKFGALSFKYKK